MIFPHDIFWDERTEKFRYLGKADDKIGHYCPIGKTDAKYCLAVCEFTRTAYYNRGFQLVCAYEAVVGQTLDIAVEQDRLKMNAEDLVHDLAEGIDWHLSEKADDGKQTFKPTPENPYGYVLDGTEPWNLGLVERPILDPRIPPPKLKKYKKGEKL